MNILIIGESKNLEEVKAKFGESNQYMLEKDHREAEQFITGNDLVFDFILDEEPFQVEIYADKANSKIFINTAKISLAELANLSDHEIKANLFGFNGLPTFLNRSALEVSVLNPNDVVDLS